MRIITGLAKGRRLLSPKSTRIRPALDQVKEAIFNILFDVQGLRILDLFAGTGSMGIEALSRGAACAAFVDVYAPAISLIKKNLERCGLEDRANVFKLRVGPAIRRLERKGGSFDIIFVDPPYLKDLVNPTLEILATSTLVGPSSIVIVEHHPKEPIKPLNGLAVTDIRRYGQTNVSFLKRTA